MPSRIWFKQQQNLHCNYLPLRWGIGQYSDEQINEFCKMFKPDAPNHPKQYCPKLYTTRTHPLSGEYIVVEGSRFKARPVEPRIKFQVKRTWKLSLKHGLIYPWPTMIAGSVWGGTNILEKDGLTFPELDLGIKGATFEQLRNELLRLNKKATLDTPFYVSKLKPVG